MKLDEIARDAALLLNPRAERGLSYGTRQRAVLDPADWRAAQAAISAWPGYRETPLAPLPGIAAALGLGGLHYKDEAGRFGLGSFKALGGAYAVARLLEREADAHGRTAGDTTVCCATDGNHGRSVAWGAQTFGCRCKIFIHEHVSEGRAAAIARYGAEVVRVSGTYDDSVRIAQETAEREGWFVVSDTSYPGYMEVPREVMQGYTVMATEALTQWPDAEPPSHLFLQTGVGGLAAAVLAPLWERLGTERPLCVLVDPAKAACWYRSLEAGRPARAEGDLETVMAGLSCGEISLLTLEILEPGADAVMTVSDEAAVGCMRLLAEGAAGDPPLVAGESRVAGLAGLIAAARTPEMRERLGLDGRSRVLLFGTEGATDPEVYEALVGRSPEAVAACT